MPRKGSALDSHLEKLKKEFVERNNKVLKYPQRHPPQRDPEISYSTDPGDWYL